MISFFKALLAALQSIAATLEASHHILATGIRQWSGVEDFEQRLGTLEREMHTREAKAEATLERAESKFKSARAAEERARHFANGARRSEEDDQGDDIDAEALEEYLATLREADAAGSDGGGVQPMRGPVASRREEREALRHSKFGR